MQYLKKKTVIVAVVGIGIFALSIAAYAYGFVALKNKAKHAAELTEAYDAELGKDTRQTELRAALRDTKDEVAELDTYFLRYDRFPEFAPFLESLGAETNTVIKPSGAIEGSKDRIGLDVTIEGRFEDVFQAIKLIELLPYRIEVRKIHISAMGTNIVSSEQSDPIVSSDVQWKAIVGFDVLSFVK